MRLTPLRTFYRNNNALTSLTYSNTGDDPFELDEVKSWARVDFSDDDAVKDNLIGEVIDIVENDLNTTIIEKTVTAVYEEYSEAIDLPLAPVKSITSVKTLDEGDETTLTSGDDYYLQGDVLYIDSVYYAQDPFHKVGLEVVYTTGWTNLPQGIKLGLKKAILSNYEDREDLFDGSVTELPNSSWKHLKKYKRY